MHELRSKHVLERERGYKLHAVQFRHRVGRDRIHRLHALLGGELPLSRQHNLRRLRLGDIFIHSRVYGLQRLHLGDLFQATVLGVHQMLTRDLRVAGGSTRMSQVPRRHLRGFVDFKGVFGLPLGDVPAFHGGDLVHIMPLWYLSGSERRRCMYRVCGGFVHGRPGRPVVGELPHVLRREVLCLDRVDFVQPLRRRGLRRCFWGQRLRALPCGCVHRLAGILHVRTLLGR